MNFKELKELIEIVATSNIEELEVERTGTRVRIRRSGSPAASAEGPRKAGESARLPSPAAVPPDAGPEATDLFYVTAPIVGTFYRASGPDTESFVNVGDFVEKGTVLCIIEAMKLMNEIESEVAGEIVSVSVENGYPVEYGERLFAIRPR